MVPVFHLPGWLLCGSVFAGFVVVSALMFVAMRRKGRSSMDFVVVETMIAAVLTGLLVFCKGTFLCKYEERVIHHPAERPHRCQYCHCSDCYGQCQKRAEARAHAAAQKFSNESVQ